MDVGDLHPEDLRAALFEHLVGETFDVAGGSPGNETLVLEELVEHQPSPGAPRADPFTLTFVGAGGDHLPQSIYALQADALGTIEIFLVPRGPGSDGRHRYDAVFN